MRAADGNHFLTLEANLREMIHPMVGVGVIAAVRCLPLVEQQVSGGRHHVIVPFNLCHLGVIEVIPAVISRVLAECYTGDRMKSQDLREHKTRKIKPWKRRGKEGIINDTQCLRNSNLITTDSMDSYHIFP